MGKGHLQLPRWQSKSAPGIASAVNTLAKSIELALRSQRVVGGKGILVTRNDHGQVISIAKQAPKAAAAAASTRKPWDIELTDNGTDYDLLVVPGNFAGLIASNHATTFSAPHTGTRYVYLDVTTADGAVTSYQHAVNATQPTPATATEDTPPTSFKFLIGVVVSELVDGSPKPTIYKVVSEDAITAQPIETHRIDKVSPSVGELPYTIYYNWLVQQ